MFLAGQPDSALAIARDTSLALGWRGEAMASLIVGPLQNGARGVMLGIPRSVVDRLEPLRHDRDPEFARLAEITWATANWINGLGPWQRIRWAMS
jgi:hypothetical protein